VGELQPHLDTQVILARNLALAQHRQRLARRQVRPRGLVEQIVDLFEAEQAQTKLARLYKLVEDGLADMADVLKGRINALKLEHDRARAALERARTAVRPSVDISPLVLERFAAMMRENLTTGAVPFRKAMITSVVDRIEVDDTEIRIIGDKGTLERAVLGSPAPPVAGKPGFAVGSQLAERVSAIFTFCCVR
jgi:site-specific DNA recombinase